MSEHEPKLNENVSEFEDSLSEESVRAVRELFKDDEKFNPVTSNRVIELFSKLPLSEMGYTLKIIVDKYIHEVSNVVTNLLW